MSLLTPLHSSQIIDLPPPKKDCIIDIDRPCGKFPMCLIVKYMFILYCIRISPLFPFDTQVVDDFIDC